MVTLIIKNHLQVYEYEQDNPNKSKIEDEITNQVKHSSTAYKHNAENPSSDTK